MHIEKSSGFTILEIVVTVVILGAISSLAFIGYKKIMDQSYCHNAQLHLISNFNAAQIQSIKTGVWTTNAGQVPLSVPGPIMIIQSMDYPVSSVIIRYPGNNCTINFKSPLSTSNPSCTNTACEKIIK